MQNGSHRLILASQSARRVDLLSLLGLEFEVVPSNIEETFDESLTPGEVVVHLALEKAKNVAKQFQQSNLKQSSKTIVVIGADTIVVCDRRVLGKPASAADARKMLAFLSDRDHEVYTGLALISLEGLDVGKTLTKSVASKVCFRSLAPEEIAAYVETKEPMDKAGSYALQGTGAAFVNKIEGCFTNVIGLPVPDLVQMLRQLGVKVLGLPSGG